MRVHKIYIRLNTSTHEMFLSFLVSLEESEFWIRPSGLQQTVSYDSPSVSHVNNANDIYLFTISRQR